MSTLRTFPAAFPTPLVGVLGGGRMGAGIAHAFLITVPTSLVVERDEASAEAARERVESAAAKSIERGAADGNLDEMVSRLAVTVDYDDFADRPAGRRGRPRGLGPQAHRRCADRGAPRRDAVPRHQHLSLSVNGLAARAEAAAELPGPALLQPGARRRRWSRSWSASTLPSRWPRRPAAGSRRSARPPIIVNDSPGFASVRLGVAIALEAMRMVEEGVASAEDIDTAMTLGYKHPVGPAADHRHRGARRPARHRRVPRASTLGERFAPPQILRDKVARGELGRKTGKGFFDWTK